MIRMKRLMEKAYGVSHIEKIKEVIIGYDELKDLDDLGVDLESEDITEFMDKFLDVFSTNAHLTSLKINDKRLWFDVNVIFRQRQNIPSLQEFSLVTQDEFFLKSEEDLPLFISSLIAASHVQFSFCKTDFSHGLLLKMVGSVGSLAKAENLFLAFKFSSKFDDEVLNILCQKISTLKHLKHFHLDVQGTSISDAGVSQLANTLASISSLESIDINLQQCLRLTSEGSAKYFQTLLSNPRVSKFNTHIISPHEDPLNNIHYESFKHFQNSLKQLNDAPSNISNASSFGKSFSSAEGQKSFMNGQSVKQKYSSSSPFPAADFNLNRNTFLRYNSTAYYAHKYIYRLIQFAKK